jgi:dolichol-phosphate mannosyltransferase
MLAPLISLVVPVYKEERNIAPFLERVEPVLSALGDYEIIFGLDPSPDNTEQVIRAAADRNPRIGLLLFSRRFGQPAATMAGILNCRGDWCCVIDVDLQDPPEVIPKLLAKAAEGFDVVLARRSSREGETALKKAISALGYAIINRIAQVQIPRDTGDFRIINRRVIEELRRMPEGHGFLRGMVALVGFRQCEVEYQRHARHSGAGNYNRDFGSLKIGFNGLFGFSTFPLQIMMWAGFGIALLSVVGIFVIAYLKLVLLQPFPWGIPTVTVLVLFMGGVQLCGIGVLGEYVGRIYDEVRRRPMYIIQSALNVAIRQPRGPGFREEPSTGA